jgi:fumarylacetoacetase
VSDPATTPLLGFGALPTGVAARREDGVVVDLSHLGGAYHAPCLNAVLALGPDEWLRMREAVDAAPEAPAGVTPLPPVRAGDYVDFYACEHHVTNMGRRFRPQQPPLPPAWRHVPLGYHGRTSTIVASGAPVFRPWGMLAGEPPAWGPTQRLDVEVELGFVVGTGNERGHRVHAADAWDRIFGAVVLNDWSARDIQAFETVPLGPHLGKSFCTTISPWVVPLDLLPRVPCEGTRVELADHLRDDDHDHESGIDLDLELVVDGRLVTRTNARHLSWSPAQMYAAMTSNGAAVRSGDLFGTGTISGPEPGTEGSLLELGVPFLADGQTATVRSARLGDATGRIDPCPAT